MTQRAHKLQGGFSTKTTPYVLSAGKIGPPLEPHTENAKLGTLHRLGNDLREFFPNDAKMVRMGVDDDGSCYYHSLACGLNFEGYHSMEKKDRIHQGHLLRKMFEESLTPTTWLNYWNGQGISTKQVPDINEMKRQMSKTKIWANVYSIMFTMWLLGLNLIVFDQTTGEIYCGTHNNTYGNTIFICWIQHSHFEPILQVTSKGLVGMFPKNHPLLVHVNKAYQKQGCPRVSLGDILKSLRRKQRAARRSKRRQRRSRRRMK